MALTSQDLVKGVDFTGINPATAADHNNLIEQSSPKNDGADDKGFGFIIVTTDSALDLPDVPNATAVVKWKRYAWFRRPFAGATDKKSILYSWNDDATNHATFRKWVRVDVDLSEIEADVAEALASASNAVSTVELFSSNLNTVSNTATQALSTANTASGNAATALANSNTALTTANDAAADAENAETIANNALTAANGNKTLAQITVGSAAGQRIRSNDTNTNWEAYLASNTYVKVSETQAKNTDAGNSVLGANVRTLNTEDNDTGNLASLAAGKITLAAGTYRVSIVCIGRNVNAHQAMLVRDSDNVVLLTGLSVNINGSSVNTPSFICGLVTLSGSTVLRIDHYFSAGATNGLGLATNLHPDAGGKEVYVTAEFEKIV